MEQLVEIPETRAATQRPRKRLLSTPQILLFGVFVLYLVLRLYVWNQTILFEDTDSLSYLGEVSVFRTFDLERIIDLPAVTTPAFPFTAAVFSLTGMSLESSARAVSVFFSLILFLAILGIGRRMSTDSGTILGLAILAVSPPLLSLSVAILTEPMYIGIIYVALWLFIRHFRKLDLKNAALLGLIIGVAFLTRIEGIIYLGIFPVLKGLYFIWKERTAFNVRRFGAWALVFIACFMILAVPQVLRVSQKMDTFALNGRQVWSVLMNNDNGKSYMENIHGLDYSPSQINIIYALENPEVTEAYGSVSPASYLRTAALNFRFLYERNMGIIVGPLLFIFFGFGLMDLFRRRRGPETLVLGAFIVLSVVPALLHNVIIRHIIVIAPIIILVAGIGIRYLVLQLTSGTGSRSIWTYGLSAVLLMSTAAVWTVPLYSALRPPDRNIEYSPMELSEPVRLVREIAQDELRRAPIIASEREYLAYYSEGKQHYLPYTDYEGLVRYCRLNNADFLYVQHQLINDRGYPFYAQFTNGDVSAEFTLIYRGEDAYGEPVELYRVNAEDTVTDVRTD